MAPTRPRVDRDSIEKGVTRPRDRTISNASSPVDDVPLHPVLSMQEAFEESIREAAQGHNERDKDDRDAEARRKALLDNDSYDPSWMSRWKQQPSARCHPVLKLMSQIVFGLHLLQQRQAKSNAEVVKILQVHVDDIDAFLERATEDFALAIKDIGERIGFLRLPMTHLEVFDSMLDDRKFRTQLMEGNDKIEKIIDRTAKAMNATLLDVQQGVNTTQQLSEYLDSVKDKWPSETPEQSAIFIAMKGNEEGWRSCLRDLQTKGHALGVSLVQLGTVVGEMSKLAAAASRRATAVDSPLQPSRTFNSGRTSKRQAQHQRAASMQTEDVVHNKPLPKDPDVAKAAVRATIPPPLDAKTSEQRVKGRPMVNNLGVKRDAPLLKQVSAEINGPVIPSLTSKPGAVPTTAISSRPNKNPNSSQTRPNTTSRIPGGVAQSEKMPRDAETHTEPPASEVSFEEQLPVATSQVSSNTGQQMTEGSVTSTSTAARPITAVASALPPSTSVDEDISDEEVVMSATLYPSTNSQTSPSHRRVQSQSSSNTGSAHPLHDHWAAVPASTSTSHTRNTPSGSTLTALPNPEKSSAQPFNALSAVAHREKLAERSPQEQMYDEVIVHPQTTSPSRVVSPAPSQMSQPVQTQYYQPLQPQVYQPTFNPMTPQYTQYQPQSSQVYLPSPRPIYQPVPVQLYQQPIASGFMPVMQLQPQAYQSTQQPVMSPQANQPRQPAVPSAHQIANTTVAPAPSRQASVRDEAGALATSLQEADSKSPADPPKVLEDDVKGRPQYLKSVAAYNPKALHKHMQAKAREMDNSASGQSRMSVSSGSQSTAMSDKEGKTTTKATASQEPAAYKLQPQVISTSTKPVATRTGSRLGLFPDTKNSSVPVQPGPNIQPTHRASLSRSTPTLSPRYTSKVPTGESKSKKLVKLFRKKPEEALSYVQ